MKDLEKIITKELLREVLPKETENLSEDFSFYIDEDYIVFRDEGETLFDYNIYKFAFKCKEWAENKGYIIFSKNKESLIYSIDEVYDVIECLNQYEDYFESDTECEAIIKACEWILDNEKNPK